MFFFRSFVIFMLIRVNNMHKKLLNAFYFLFKRNTKWVILLSVVKWGVRNQRLYEIKIHDSLADDIKETKDMKASTLDIQNESKRNSRAVCHRYEKFIEIFFKRANISKRIF